MVHDIQDLHFHDKSSYLAPARGYGSAHYISATGMLAPTFDYLAISAPTTYQ